MFSRTASSEKQVITWELSFHEGDAIYQPTQVKAFIDGSFAQYPENMQRPQTAAIAWIFK